MTIEEFQEILSKEPVVSRSFRNAAKAIPISRHKFGAPAELAAIVILFPVAVYIVNNFGLPWLDTAKKYSEMWRLKFDKWINEQYAINGLDPEMAKIAGEALQKELQRATTDAERKAWESFAGMIRSSENSEE